MIQIPDPLADLYSGIKDGASAAREMMAEIKRRIQSSMVSTLERALQNVSSEIQNAPFYHTSATVITSGSEEQAAVVGGIELETVSSDWNSEPYFLIGDTVTTTISGSSPQSVSFRYTVSESENDYTTNLFNSLEWRAQQQPFLEAEDFIPTEQDARYTLSYTMGVDHGAQEVARSIEFNSGSTVVTYGGVPVGTVVVATPPMYFGSLDFGDSGSPSIVQRRNKRVHAPYSDDSFLDDSD